jgi:antitoxin component YwqK of YwqJK toxin-antitoxin module
MIIERLIFIAFLLFQGCSSQTINESDLIFTDNLWYSDSDLYSGEVYQIVRKEKKVLGVIEKGIKEDYWIEFGSLIWREGAYLNGNKIGKWNGYYVDSTKAYSGKYIDGLKDGLWYGWNKEGKLIYEGGYKTGKKDGIWVYLYDNGQISDSGNYQNDLMTGQWKYWFENGTKMKEGSYNSKNGQEMGDWIYYNADGSWKKEQNFSDHKEELTD